MYVGFYINSEYPTCLSRTVRETVEEIKEAFLAEHNDNLGTAVLTEEKPEYSKRAITRFVVDQGDNYWLVMEVFEIPENKCCLARWHAYEGVGFDVTWHSTKEEAYQRMKREYLDYGDYLEEGHLDRDSAVIDTGNEWLNWEILDKGRF